MARADVIEVVGAVIERNGLVLCALRSPTGSLPNVWEFPGGKIEPGESASDALTREVHEELDCVISVGELITTATHPQRAVVIRLHTYRCELREGEPRAKEHAALRWLRPAELAGLPWAPADLPTVDILLRDAATALD